MGLLKWPGPVFHRDERAFDVAEETCPQKGLVTVHSGASAYEGRSSMVLTQAGESETGRVDQWPRLLTKYGHVELVALGGH